MADPVNGIIPQHIPNSATLLMRAHRDCFSGGDLQTSVFRFRAIHDFKESADWAGFEGRKAEHTRAAARVPHDNAVISLPVEHVRAVEGVIEVEHAPTSDNHSHCLIVGDPDMCRKAENLTQIRLMLYKIAKIVIQLDQPVRNHSSTSSG